MLFIQAFQNKIYTSSIIFESFIITAEIFSVITLILSFGNISELKFANCDKEEIKQDGDKYR